MSELARTLPTLKYEFVILSKVDKEGSCNLLHTKPLHGEFIYANPDSILTFSEGNSSKTNFYHFFPNWT